MSLMGGGSENGSLSKLSGYHCPVMMSWFSLLAVNIVVSKYLELLFQMLFSAKKVSENDRCTKQSRQKTKLTLGNLS